MSPGVAAFCPNCGAPLSFSGGHSLATVCGYCRSAIARQGVDFALIGKVPDLVVTDTRLSLGQHGTVDGQAFTLIGHLQLGRPAAGDTDGAVDATWDEWYAAFADGSWGWLAEAQGRLHLTKPIAGTPPPFERLTPGHRIEGRSIPRLAVEEVGEARFVAAAGELPFAPALGATYRFVDLSGEGGAFYTFDYGPAGEAEPGQIFAGRRLGYSEAGLSAGAAPAPTAHAAALACPHCGASLSLKQEDTETLTCPSCRSLIERSQAGSLRLLLELAAREDPPLPLGSRGTLGGEPAEVLGWMRRSTEVDGTRYDWDEYLLIGPSGYRWLTESDGQWHLVSPIDAGKVELAGQGCMVGGKLLKHFQGAEAVYQQLQGEFYWRVPYQRSVVVNDYVAPPLIVSSENDGQEESWSAGRWISGQEVWAAFALPGAPPVATGVGAAQPNPWSRPAGRAWMATFASLLVLLAACVVLPLALPSERVLSVDVALTAEVPLAAAGEPMVYVSDPFTLAGGRRAVELKAYAMCEQSWVGLDLALINDDTGESEAVGLELSYYQGIDDGERWSEGSRGGKQVIGAVQGGRYVLRVEPQFGRDRTGRLPETVHVEVIRGAFLWTPPILVAILLLLYPLYASVRSGSFENRRWAASDHPPGGSS